MKRIKLCILIILLIVSNSIFGQSEKPNTKPKNWTMGAILLNDGNFFNYYGGTISQNYLVGLTVKRHFKNLTLRMAIEHTNSVYIDGTQNDFGGTIRGYSNEGILRLGIEKGFVVKIKYRPYYAIELAGASSHTDYTEDTHGPFVAMNHRYITASRSFEIMPTIGFEYKFTKIISLSIETRVRCFYNWTSMDVKNLYDSSEPYTEKDRFFDTYFNPLSGLTLNVRF